VSDSSGGAPESGSPRNPAPSKLAASYFLWVAGITVLGLLWFRGLLRPMMPILLILAGVLVVSWWR
jgi:apolipoprotein N-acyltransferase